MIYTSRLFGVLVCLHIVQDHTLKYSMVEYTLGSLYNFILRQFILMYKLYFRMIFNLQMVYYGFHKVNIFHLE